MYLLPVQKYHTSKYVVETWHFHVKGLLPDLPLDPEDTTIPMGSRPSRRGGMCSCACSTLAKMCSTLHHVRLERYARRILPKRVVI